MNCLVPSLAFFKAIAAYCIAVILATSLATSAHSESYKDSDWNVRMKDNCGQPVTRGSNASVKWVDRDSDRGLRVMLDRGQVGKCWTDSKPNKWSSFRERAEVQLSKFMRLGKRYQISFSVAFDEGFDGFKETFFQIHGWNGDCHAAPPVMFLFHEGKLIIWSLRGVRRDGESTWQSNGFGSHKRVQERIVRLRDLRGRENTFVVDFDTRGPTGTLSVWVNGQPVVDQATVEYASCAKPYIKMGVYRDGGHGTGRSMATFDDIRVQVVK